MFNMFGQIGSSALGLLGSVINTRQINEANKQIARETNAANREMVEMQNKAAAAESEKAYQRSKASTQVTNMMQAGMSRAGAINALNGGGSYTPAPVNTSQDSAPQMQTTDFSALANIGQAFAQRAQQKHDEKMLSKQLAAQKEENAANRQTQKEIAQINADSSKYGTDKSFESNENRLEWEKKMFEELSPYQKREYDARIKNIDANTEFTKEQKNDLKFRVLEYQSSEQTAARKAKALFEGIEADLGYRINQYEFDRFVNKFYTRNEQGELVPKRWISNAEEVQEGARTIWNTILEIIPLRVLSEVLGFSGEQASTAATLMRLL